MVSINLMKEKVTGELIDVVPNDELASVMRSFERSNGGKKLLAIKLFSNKIVLVNPDAIVTIEHYQ